jgi:predicted nucleotidyltransferase
VNQQTKYQKAINKFIQSIKDDDEIIGVLLAGSFVRSELDKNSDVDIHVIIDEKCNYRERGNLWIEGVEIEYFKNPPKQIRSYFKKEKDPHTADMLADSKVIYKSSEIIDELIDEARQILRVTNAKPDINELELFKYVVDDLFKDLEDCLVKNDKIGFSLVKTKLIDESIFIFIKLKQVRETKRKKLFAKIKDLDSEFAELIAGAVEERLLEKEKISNLVKYIENLLGGKRTKKWVLKSDLDL